MMRNVLIIFFFVISFTAGPRRVPDLFRVYNQANLAPGQYLYKQIPSEVKLTWDVDCTAVNSITAVPCEIYLLKDAQYFNGWDKGVRDSNLWFIPPTDLNATTQNIIQDFYVPQNTTGYAYFIVIFFNFTVLDL